MMCIQCYDTETQLYVASVVFYLRCFARVLREKAFAVGFGTDSTD